ncbi:GNAT family N-acetyltransferase [Bacillus carboniphilus]|uniref:GNAT family N-acetyltransferase n=1 Tax=Bacillus carboniphilus TaxID=86663 RepID=A0ABN0WQB5_9BACI
MITELHKSDFYKCRELVNKHGQLEVKAVIEGVNPGRIFVDDAKTPASGLIWLGNNDGFIFIGDEKNEGFNRELNGFIDQVIIPEAAKEGLAWFEAIGNHEKWYSTIEKVFKHRDLGSWNQRVYILHNNDYNSQSEVSIDPKYSVLKINETLFHNQDNFIQNIEFLHSKILEFWTTPDAFFRNGIGYCVVHKNRIVSVCSSGFVVDGTHCIDIETLEEHQGQKLAQKVAHAFVKDCLAHNQVPYWDCMESNKPSVAVAEKLGFCNTFNYDGYEFSMKK